MWYLYMIPLISANSFENIKLKHFAAYTFHNLIIITPGLTDAQTFDDSKQENTVCN